MISNTTRRNTALLPTYDPKKMLHTINPSSEISFYAPLSNGPGGAVLLKIGALSFAGRTSFFLSGPIFISFFDVDCDFYQFLQISSSFEWYNQ